MTFARIVIRSLLVNLPVLWTSKVRWIASIRSFLHARPMWNSRRSRKKSASSPDRSIDDLVLSPRATDALKKAGILSIGQILAKLGEGNAAVLEIAGFGQSSLTAAKKKLRALGFEVPEVPDAPKPPKAPKVVESAEAAEAPEAEAGE